MLKAQDIVLLLKLLADSNYLNWSQMQLATKLCVSPSVINAGLKRLDSSGLLRTQNKQLVLPACEEFLISGVKYFFPAQLGGFTRGIATAYAAPVFEKQIIPGEDPIPVWPYGEGDQRGLALEPLYPSVPKSIALYPDQAFYNLLALVDAIRQGRTRERNIAVKLLKKKIEQIINSE